MTFLLKFFYFTLFLSNSFLVLASAYNGERGMITPKEETKEISKQIIKDFKRRLLLNSFLVLHKNEQEQRKQKKEASDKTRGKEHPRKKHRPRVLERGFYCRFIEYNSRGEILKRHWYNPTTKETILQKFYKRKP